MATAFQHPFHCLRFVESPQEASPGLLVASAGRSLYSFAADSGKRLATWPRDSGNEDTQAPSEEQGPPEKKRKTAAQPQWTNIPLLATSSTGKHVVALTAEDKCIRVFQLAEDGAFTQLSERPMPKRPSAIALTHDNNTILVADKFGDVYSLPLLPGDKPLVAPKSRRTNIAATPLTVHSKRNIKSLQMQLKDYNDGANQNPDKATLNFEHQLLLGHVSLLTDLAYAEVPAGDQKKRGYILTADRDEHIRVSRCPQAHVIESYCLGHTEFVTKLCVPAWAPEYLISGGGDNYLLVWKWTEGRVLQKVSLTENNETVVVRGIWSVSLSEKSKAILVALDGSAQLLSFLLEADGTLKAQESIPASGNVLDVTFIEKSGTILLSVDGVREKGSTQDWRASPSSLLESFRVKLGTDRIEWEPVTDSMVTTINSEGTSEVVASETKEREELNQSMYNLGHLRKKRMGADE